MLFRPIIRNAPWSSDASLDETLTIGSPSVFQTAPPHPASNARSTIEPMFVGGAEASQNGLGDFMPAKFMLRSAINLTSDKKRTAYLGWKLGTRYYQNSGSYTLK